MKICDNETKPKPIAFIPGNIYQMKPNHPDFNFKLNSGFNAQKRYCKEAPYMYTINQQLVSLVSGYCRDEENEDIGYWYDATDKWCVKEITQ